MSDADRADLDRWLAERDADAFRAIVLRYSGKVFAACRRVLGSATDAEEVCQECFEALARFEKTGTVKSLGAWLHGVAVNRCLHRIRTDSRRRDRQTRYSAEQTPAKEPQWDDIADHVDEAVAELPEVFREPVLAHFFENQSHAAIARVTGIPRRTVSYRIEQGLDRLAKSLKRRGVVIPATALAAVLTDNLAHAEAVPESLAKALAELAATHAAPAVSSGAAAGLLVGKKALLGLAALLAVLAGVWAARDFVARDEPPSQTTATPTAQEPAATEAISSEVRPPTAVPAVDGAVLGRVSGVVRFAGTNEPVPGLALRVMNFALRNFEFEATTDAGGAYRFIGLQPGVTYVISPKSPGAYGAVTDRPEVLLAEGESRTGIDITVAGGGPISGQILDKTTIYHPSKIASVARKTRTDDSDQQKAAWNTLFQVADQPLPGVRVVLAESGGEGRTGARRVAETTTDDEGRYAFPLTLVPGSYAVWVVPPVGTVRVKEDHRSVFQRFDLGPNEGRTDIDFSFRFDTASVSGRVTDAADRPVEGVEIVAEPLYVPEPSGDDGFRRFQTDPMRTATDEDGRYRLDGLMPANIREVWGFLGGGSLPRNGRTFTIRAGHDGYAPAQAVVPVVPDGLAKTGMAYIEGFAAAGIGDGGMGREYSDARMPQGEGNDITGIDFVLQNQAVVSGRLIDSRGEAVLESRVRMVLAEPGEKKQTALAVREIEPDWVETDESGEFRIAGVPAGLFLFEATSKGGGTQKARNAPIEVRVGETIAGIEVIVESTAERGGLAGRVVDAVTKQVIRKPAVRVTRVDSPDEPNPTLGQVAVDEEKGAFTVEGCSPGVATVWVAAEGYPPVEVLAGVASGRVQDVLVQLTPEGMVEGHVSLNGVPAPGSVQASRVDGSDLLHPQGYRQQSLSGHAGHDGYYTIHGLPPGDYYMQASVLSGTDATAYYRQEWTTATVAAGHVTRVDVNVTGGAVIRGTLAFPDAYQRAYVHLLEGRAEGLTPREPATAYRLRLRASTDRFRESGAFEFVNLPPGTYTLTAFGYYRNDLQDAGLTPDDSRIWHTVLIAPAQTLEVDLALEGP
jgi:RNA polymerase sigma factor (sigma-70 family)